MGYLLGGGEAIANTQIPALLDALASGCADIVNQPAPPVSDACYQAPRQAEVGLALEPVHQPAARWWVASYSALSIADANMLQGVEAMPALAPATALEANLKEEEPAPAGASEALSTGLDIHGFPRGASPGTFLHGLLEWAGREGFERMLHNPLVIEGTIARRCNLRDWESWIAPLCTWLTAFVQEPLRFAGSSVSLAGLQTYQVEMEFWFSSSAVSIQRLDQLVCQYTLNGAARPLLESGQLNGMFKGFIDLTFEYQGRYYVADYKSNWLGRDDSGYTPQAMAETMLNKRYDLQFSLYLLALHRQLKLRLPDYDYDRHMGGAVYLFVRGHQSASQGVHFERPPRELIEQMDQLFMGQYREVSA